MTTTIKFSTRRGENRAKGEFNMVPRPPVGGEGGGKTPLGGLFNLSYLTGVKKCENEPKRGKNDPKRGLSHPPLKWVKTAKNPKMSEIFNSQSSFLSKNSDENDSFV
jgi:hypothetical protein